MTKFTAKPGWIIIDTSSASGGVHYQRKALDEHATNGGEGIESRHETVKTVDHVILCKEIDSLVKHTDYILRKNCARTAFGYYATDAQLAAVRAETEKLQEQADALNNSAKVAGSARRAYIAIVPAQIDLCTPEAAQEIARTVREVLTALADTLLKGELGQFNNVWLRAKNLPSLATGVQADSITFALECARDVAKGIRETKKSGGEECPMDLSCIQAAIDLFSGEAGAQVSDAA